MALLSNQEKLLEEWHNGKRLHIAAMDGNIDELKHLLKTDYLKSLNSFDDFGQTPLHLAASNEHIEAVKLLIEAGADVNAHDEGKIGDTALGQIAGEVSFEMVKLLIDAGANPKIKGWMQLNALDRAKQRKEEEGKNIFCLLEATANKFRG